MKNFLFAGMTLFLIASLSKQDEVEKEDEVNDDNKNTHEEEQKISDDEPVTNLFSQEWEKKMNDYEPSYVYMLPIKSRKTEKYYEDIAKVPVTIRGAFLTDENVKDKLEFIVTDPNNKLIYKNFTNECIFDFQATIPGTYQFKFRNSQSKNELKVTFTMNTYQDEVLQKEHLTFTEQKVESLMKFVEKIKFEEGLVSKKKAERRKSNNNI